MGGERADFFVSYTGADQRWAEWIAWQLEAAGYSTVIQAWDFGAGSHFVREMHRAAQQARRTVAVLSGAYLRSAFAEAEWQAAWVGDPAGEQRRLLVLRVEDCDRPGLLRQVVGVDLFGVDEDAARRRLLAAAANQRGKPTQPPAFPGTTAPGFPGSPAPTGDLDRPVNRVSNVPPRNPAFTGRQGLLDELGRRLAAGPVAVVAVRGLGGVGKSQLALEYAHRGLIEARYEVAWWVRAETPLTVAEDLAALAPALGMSAGRDEEETVAAVRAVLGRRDGWLLVFDNASTAGGLRRWLPGGAGHVLVTSRDRGWAGVATQVDVVEFSRVESVDYLRRWLGRDDPDADALAAAVGDLPLALAQAASYVDLHGGLSIGRYLALYRDRQVAGRLLAEGIDGYPRSVATTWLIHLTDLAEQHPAALELLRLCAHLDPDDINLDSLLSRPDLLNDPLTAQLAHAAADPGRREEAIGALARTGLVTRLDDDRVRIHRLVAQITRYHLAADSAASSAISVADGPVDPRMDPQWARRWARRAVTTVAGLFPDQPREPANWPACADLAAHAVTVVDHATDLNTATGNAGAVLDLLGQYLHSRAEYTRARTTLERALAIRENQHGSDHPQVAATLGNLGIVQRQLGELPAARTSQQRALALKEKAYGPDHPDVAATLVPLAVVQRQLGELPAARTALERALAILEAAYGPEHPDVATTLTNFGIVQQELGELPAARSALERALAIVEAAYGPEHPDVATTLTNFGIVQQELGELPAARSALERALAIKEKAYGPDHPDVARTLGILGNVQQRLGELPAARTALERALAILEAVYGPDNPEVATTLTNFGIVEQQLGKEPAARATLERALAIKEKAYGPDHPDVARTLTNLGNVQRQLGELPAARTSQQRALAILEAAYGPDHPEVAITLTNLGNVQRQLGELPAARTSQQRALAIFEALYGPDHPHTILARRLVNGL